MPQYGKVGFFNPHEGNEEDFNSAFNGIHVTVCYTLRSKPLPVLTQASVDDMGVADGTTQMTGFVLLT